MTRKKDPSEGAVQHHDEGYNCAQSVLLALSEDWNIRNELIPKVATGLGGGIGRSGSVCGALTGGVLALGLKYGTNESSAEKRKEAYEKSSRLYKRFRTEFGTVLCKELIGYDLSNPKELEEAQKADVFQNRCTNFIRQTAGFVEEL